MGLCGGVFLGTVVVVSVALGGEGLILDGKAR